MSGFRPWSFTARGAGVDMAILVVWWRSRPNGIRIRNLPRVRTNILQLPLAPADVGRAVDAAMRERRAGRVGP